MESIKIPSSKSEALVNLMIRDEQMIIVSVNGEVKELEENLNVTQMIEALEYKIKGFAVAVNTTFVPIAKYDETMIKEGDTIDILAPVQGG